MPKQQEWLWNTIALYLNQHQAQDALYASDIAEHVLAAWPSSPQGKRHEALVEAAEAVLGGNITGAQWGALAKAVADAREAGLDKVG